MCIVSLASRFRPQEDIFTDKWKLTRHVKLKRNISAQMCNYGNKLKHPHAIVIKVIQQAKTGNPTSDIFPTERIEVFYCLYDIFNDKFSLAQTQK